MPISSYELLSLPKTNMKNESSENVTGLKFESRTRTQSRTRSNEHFEGDDDDDEDDVAGEYLEVTKKIAFTIA